MGLMMVEMALEAKIWVLSGFVTCGVPLLLDQATPMCAQNCVCTHFCIQPCVFVLSEARLSVDDSYSLSVVFNLSTPVDWLCSLKNHGDLENH